VEDRLSASLTQNMSITSELKDLLAQNIELNIELTKTVERLSQQVHAMVCEVTPGNA
jgi:regulator of replication initiation timing